MRRRRAIVTHAVVDDFVYTRVSVVVVVRRRTAPFGAKPADNNIVFRPKYGGGVDGPERPSFVSAGSECACIEV